MPAPKTPETTVPSDDTRDVEARERLAIRWLFPGLDGRLTPLPPGGLVLGRGEDCDVVMDSAETSRRHAEIRREGPLWIVRDLGSRNGTFVNGQRVSTGPLSPRDLLRFGDWIGVLVTTTDGGPGAVYESFTPGLYGGPALRPTLELARRAAASALPVIVEGETGTGKEGLCRAIATWSGRAGPFLAVNCAAIPESLAEAELFGYRKGAFTGAERASPGYFRAADGGTLMLDEIIDLSPPVQTKLLRALEQREVVPLGESAPVPIDVRVVVAAQEPLGQAVKEKRFRADLYARLNGVTLRLPPLRERVEEIPFLFTRLMQDQTGGRPADVEARAIERLCLYDWPFNLRELDLLVKRLLVMRPDGQVRRSDLPETMMFPEAEPPAPETEARAAARPARPRSPEDRQARDEQDLAALKEALRAAHGNVVRAAQAAGMTRQRAYRLMGQRPDIKLGELRAGGAGKPGQGED